MRNSMMQNLLASISAKAEQLPETKTKEAFFCFEEHVGMRNASLAVRGLLEPIFTPEPHF